MASGAERVERFLTEFRMLVTAAGVLLAFQLQTVFSSSFLDAPVALQRIHLVGTLFGTAAFAFLLLPAAIHRRASQLRQHQRFIDVARRAIGAGFGFLALSLALGLYVQGARTLGEAWGFAMAGLGSALLLVAWVVVPSWFGKRQDGQPREESDADGEE